MKQIAEQPKNMVLALVWVPILLSAIGLRPQAATGVALSDAQFHGLTRIVVTTNVQLTGIAAAHIIVTKPDGTVVPPAKITGVDASAVALSVVIDADQFARISAQGTTIATKAFGSFKASRAVKVLKLGEPAGNGHIMSSSQWTDEGWSTSKTDPVFYDPVTGQMGLYRFADLTPNKDDKDKPIDWKDGNIVTPAHRAKNMLVLFVEFPDRRAADAGDPYTTFPAYLEFLQGAVDWFHLSSYGQFRLALASPQNANHLGWIMMSKNASQYQWNGQTHTMFAYVREACQHAYGNWNIKADDYDLLLIMPARGRPGLSNGPANINRDPTDGEQPNTNIVAYVDRDNKPHYIGTAITAGNDMFRWGYRWVTHESGHTFGFPDLYMYAPTVNGVRVGQFFYCGGWDMMGNIAGHSTDYLAWHKWKLRWIRDDQVDVVSQSSSNPTTHFITSVETPGGSKMVVIRTGLSTAYVAEFRTKLGVNALDNRGKYSGVLIYRIDASRWESRDTNPTAQIISKLFYNSPAVGGPKNLTGVWRPIDNTLNGYDSPDCCWQPGDVFSDPAAGVTIRVDGITHYNLSDPSNSPYTADDVATITVTKTMNADLYKSVVLSNAQLKDLTNLTFDTNVELQQRIPNANGGNRGTYTYIREESMLNPSNLVITKANRSVIPAKQITSIVVNPTGVQVTLAKGAFASAADAAGATVAAKAYYHFGAGAAVRIMGARPGKFNSLR
jgi:M6 family metalloprotease-like protein